MEELSSTLLNLSCLQI